MKEGFLLGWIAGERGDVVGWHKQAAQFVVAHFADAALACFDQTTMPAGVTTQRVIGEMFRQFRRAFGRQLI